MQFFLIFCVVWRYEIDGNGFNKYSRIEACLFSLCIVRREKIPKAVTKYIVFNHFDLTLRISSGSCCFKWIRYCGIIWIWMVRYNALIRERWLKLRAPNTIVFISQSGWFPRYKQRRLNKNWALIFELCTFVKKKQIMMKVVTGRIELICELNLYKNMQRGMCTQIGKFVFSLGTVLLKQMEQLCKVFNFCFLSHHGLVALNC